MKKILSFIAVAFIATGCEYVPSGYIPKEIGDEYEVNISRIEHEGKYEYDSTKFTIGFMFGYEDFDNAYDKIVSAEEYLSKHGGSEYSDEEFRKMFKDFCDYFGVKEMV